MARLLGIKRGSITLTSPHLEPFAIRRHVEENFSKERMARDYRDLYARMLG